MRTHCDGQPIETRVRVAPSNPAGREFGATLAEVEIDVRSSYRFRP